MFYKTHLEITNNLNTVIKNLWNLFRCYLISMFGNLKKNIDEVHLNYLTPSQLSYGNIYFPNDKHTHKYEMEKKKKR